MPRRTRSVSRLEDQLRNARSRARRLAAQDPIQRLGMGAVGGAIIALMNNNNLKLPIPNVPGSLQVGALALLVSKGLKPKGALGKAVEATLSASGAVFGYGLANKFGPGGNKQNELTGIGESFEMIGAGNEIDYIGTLKADHIVEG